MKSGLFALGLFALVSAEAQAQTLVASNAGAQAASSFAGASFGSPIAFGADWGSVGVGFFAQTLDKDIAGVDGDGSAGVAFGLGDADRYVGLETQVSISSLSGTSGDHFGDVGSMGFKLHTNLGSGAAFAVGVTNTARWGRQQNEASVYAVATKVFKIGTSSPRALVANIGIGDKGFQEIGRDGAGVFGSLAFYVTPQVSVVADYTGRFLNAGISAAPFRTLPFTVTLGGVNLTSRYNNDPQVAVTLGYGFQF
ncbi:MAG: hypothetical protein V4607_03095 [Pseudomonadota bacterium]